MSSWARPKDRKLENTKSREKKHQFASLVDKWIGKNSCGERTRTYNNITLIYRLFQERIFVFIIWSTIPVMEAKTRWQKRSYESYWWASRTACAGKLIPLVAGSRAVANWHQGVENGRRNIWFIFPYKHDFSQSYQRVSHINTEAKYQTGIKRKSLIVSAVKCCKFCYQRVLDSVRLKCV